MADNQEHQNPGDSRDQRAPELGNVTSVDDLVARATAKYAQKEYREAAELYSQATETQAEKNGEMSPLNADLLFCYGRCLFHVAIEHSDVLGSKVAREAQGELSSSKGDKSRGGPSAFSNAAPKEDAPLHRLDTQPQGQSANLRFIGDDDYTNSDEDQEGGAAPSEHAEEEDDFSNAFEILDLARVLLSRSLQEVPGSEDSLGQGEEHDTKVSRLKERLADTYDLQGEISLEGEQFSTAVRDLKAALDLRVELYPPYSNLVAETHFKLSLALEFASAAHSQGEAANGNSEQPGPSNSNDSLRKEAIEHTEAAIASCNLRISREEARLTGSSSENHPGTETTKGLRGEIADVKDMVREMKQRVRRAQQSHIVYVLID